MKQNVIDAINSERDYQEKVWPKGSGCHRSVGEEILCMEACLLVARNKWQSGDDFNKEDLDAMLSEIRKVVAVGVRCLENHGAPLR